MGNCVWEGKRPGTPGLEARKSRTRHARLQGLSSQTLVSRKLLASDKGVHHHYQSPSGPRGQVQAMPLPHTAPRPVQLQSPPTYKDTVLPGTRSVCNQSLLHGPRRSGEGYPGRTVKSEARINTENAHQGLTALGQYGALSHTGSSQA